MWEEGAFALIDCLGWKGIWNRKIGASKKPISPSKILKKVDQIEGAVREAINDLRFFFSKAYINFTPHIAFLSDTVVISVPMIEHEDQRVTEGMRRAFAVQMACLMVAHVLDSFVEEEPYLSMRGCVTYGKYSIKGSTFVGPAVDEAANNYELPDGAFVWVHPKGAKQLEHLQDLRIDLEVKAKSELPEESFEAIKFIFSAIADPPIVLRDYEMPLKDGRTLVSMIVNPLMVIRESEQRAITIGRYDSSFDKDTVEVLLKKQNTMSFLREAADASLEFYEQPLDLELLGKLKEALFESKSA